MLATGSLWCADVLVGGAVVRVLRASRKRVVYRDLETGKVNHEPGIDFLQHRRPAIMHEERVNLLKSIQSRRRYHASLQRPGDIRDVLCFGGPLDGQIIKTHLHYFEHAEPVAPVLRFPPRPHVGNIEYRMVRYRVEQYRSRRGMQSVAFPCDGVAPLPSQVEFALRSIGWL